MANQKGNADGTAPPHTAAEKQPDGAVAPDRIRIPDAPIFESLIGILNRDGAADPDLDYREEYRQYIEKKYGA